MTERFEKPEEAPPVHALGNDGPESLMDIDQIIVRLRAAHDAGLTIEAINAGLATIVRDTDATPDETLQQGDQYRSGRAIFQNIAEKAGKSLLGAPASEDCYTISLHNQPYDPGLSVDDGEEVGRTNRLQKSLSL
jgi:hypothetical protein